jgi:modulator of FtsH protease HflC
MNNKLWLLIAALVVVLLNTLTYQVRENQTVIVTRFGAPVTTTNDSGLRWKMPWPIDAVVPIDMRLHMLDPEEGEYLTMDKKNLLVDSFLVWSVADPLTYFKSVGNRQGAEARLTDIFGSVVSSVLSSFEFQDILSVEGQAAGLQRIAEQLQKLTAARAEATMGIQIHSAAIKRLNFPNQNKRAVFQRMEAERQAISAGHRSEGKELYDKIKAQTDREEAQLLADARRRAAEIRGAADAQAARIYAQAYAQDEELYKFLRTLRALEGTLSDDSLIVLPSDHALLQVLQNPPESKVPANAEGATDHD